MSDRIRLVVMGDSYVGKSSIVKRFLFGKFDTKYVATVDDLYSRDFELNDSTLRVDILDTAGDAQFPAMRRLSIASAQAFLLVYSVTDPPSFNTVKQRFEEIREQRADYQELPIIVAGNKVDVVREISNEDVEQWMSSHIHMMRVRAVECAAATNKNICEVFKSFLTLSTNCLLLSAHGNTTSKSTWLTVDGPGLKRNLSARERRRTSKCFDFDATETTENSRPSSPAFALNEQRKELKQSSSGTSSRRGSLTLSSPWEFKLFRFNGKKSKERDQPPQPPPQSPLQTRGYGVEPGGYDERGKTCKRSRSLIRRSSGKAHRQVRDVSGTDECIIA